MKQTKMKISNEKPPIYDNACAAFKVNPRTVLFTYGDTIYNPGEVDIPKDLIAHEEVHGRQQNMNDKDAELWWGKYLRDPEFRLSQEVEAYGKQYKYVCDKVTQNRQMRWNMLLRMSEILSGGLYGNCVGLHKAMSLIKEASK